MTAPAAAFSFLAERLCLDFANTVDWHDTDHPGERVHTPADVIRWAAEAGALDATTAAALHAHAAAHPRRAAALLARARALREVIYRVFSALSHGHSPLPEDLGALDTARLEAARHQRLVPDGHRFTLTWDAPGDDLNRVWWPVALDAADLLTGGPLERVRQCADDRGCGWLFLDTSKAGRRRWCSMEDCGNRAKAQRHRQRATV
ncbi:MULTISPECIES: CGNR zinc finger domain-containing protein [Deinococcus]|uniref:CGNR zinc finger domain-containing protein n=1 Tax=Deinococcus rufus TaxID=2136097 RepID=A0ABV7ZC83_9DEIO|nr:ABATE domain-containing protein [Deinococcus sp. AB2017081]WQE95697.1 ABATE domain-containing protein [Deinococcus sp. AB2017081]